MLMALTETSDKLWMKTKLFTNTVSQKTTASSLGEHFAK